METFLKILNYISGPVVGAIIGYFTNYLAVKMLFRPYKAKKIGKWTLPFTPGIMPKRQPQLAKAIGKAVGEKLFTADDIKNAVLEKDFKQNTINLVLDGVYGKENAQTVDSLLDVVLEENQCHEIKEKASLCVTERLIHTANKLNVGELIAKQGIAVINEKKSSLGMLAMMISDDMLNGVLMQVGEKINDYISENGQDLLLPLVREELNTVTSKTVDEIFSKEKCEKIISAAYDKIVSKAIDGLLKDLNISAVVEAKINAMDMHELEALCMSVMKKELNAVVNLGAVIGFLLGIINIFI